jgi:hypothetical protein
MTIDLPDTLKGKTLEEAYTLLKADHDREITELKAAQVASPPVTVTPVTPPPAYKPFTPPPMAPEPQGTEPDLFNSPDAYMEKQFQQRVAPLAASITESMKNTNKEVFRGRVGEAEWSKYGAEIEQFVSSLHPTVQMQMGAFDAAYRYIRGTKVDQIVAEEAGKQADAAVAKALSAYGIVPQQPVTPPPAYKPSLFQPQLGVVTSPTPPGHFTMSHVPKSTLSPEQQRVAKEFDLTEAEYSDMAKLNTDWISQAKEGTNG